MYICTYTQEAIPLLRTAVQVNPRMKFIHTAIACLLVALNEVSH